VCASENAEGVRAGPDDVLSSSVVDEERLRVNPSTPDIPPCEHAAVKKLLLKIGINGVALWVTTLVVSGVKIVVDPDAPDATKQKVITVLIVAVVFAAVNTLVKPLVQIATFGLFILTLGLITFVINALMLLLTSKVCDHYHVRFHVDGLGAALIGALVISVVSIALHAMLPDDVKR
jgi:putative membrane protein